MDGLKIVFSRYYGGSSTYEFTTTVTVCTTPAESQDR